MLLVDGVSIPRHFASLRTILSTARKQGWNLLETLTHSSVILTHNLRTSWRNWDVTKYLKRARNSKP